MLLHILLHRWFHILFRLEITYFHKDFAENGFRWYFYEGKLEIRAITSKWHRMISVHIPVVCVFLKVVMVENGYLYNVSSFPYWGSSFPWMFPHYFPLINCKCLTFSTDWRKRINEYFSNYNLDFTFSFLPELYCFMPFVFVLKIF